MIQSPSAFIGLRPACLPDQYSGFDLTTLRSPPVVVGWGSTVTGGSTVNALREVMFEMEFLTLL